MKSKTCITALTLLTALAIPVRLAAENNRDHHHKHHHYQLIDEVGTFGGPNSIFALPAPEVRVLTNSGTAVGGADTSTPDPTCIAFNSDCYVGYGFFRNLTLGPLEGAPSAAC